MVRTASSARTTSRAAGNEGGQQEADAQQDDAFWALEPADVGGLETDALGAGAGVAHHQRADQRQVRQRDAQAVAGRLIPPHQTEEHGRLGIPIAHRIQEGAEDRYPIGRAGQRAVERIGQAEQPQAHARGQEPALGDEQPDAGRQDRAQDRQRVGRKAKPAQEPRRRLGDQRATGFLSSFTRA